MSSRPVHLIWGPALLVAGIAVSSARAQNQTPPNDPPSVDYALKLIQDAVKQMPPVTLSVHYQDVSETNSYFQWTQEVAVRSAQVVHQYNDKNDVFFFWDNQVNRVGPLISFFPALQNYGLYVKQLKQAVVKPFMSRRGPERGFDRAEPAAWVVELEAGGDHDGYFLVPDESLANRVAKAFERAAEICRASNNKAQ